MNKQEKINWLTEFNNKWEEANDIIDSNEKSELFQKLNNELYNFLEENGYNPNINITSDDFQHYFEKIKAEKDEIEKSAFNDAGMFVEHYKEFLVGKRISFGKDKGTYELVILPGFGIYKDNVTIPLKLEGEDTTSQELNKSDFENFINGFAIADGDRYFKLLLEEGSKTPFNDADTFVHEFKGFLIGKKITYGKGDNFIIKNISVVETYPEVNKISLSAESNIEEIIDSEDFQRFIDGDEINGVISLILQDEPTIEKINQPDYKYYILNFKTKKIITGWEYIEDAKDALQEIIEYGGNEFLIKSKKVLLSEGVDPDDNSNWSNESCDYSIIEEAIQYGVTKEDYSQELANRFIGDYKEKEGYKSVIKARLIYFLNDSNKHFVNEISNCQYENALRLSEIIARINSELLKIVKKEA